LWRNDHQLLDQPCFRLTADALIFCITNTVISLSQCTNQLNRPK